MNLEESESFVDEIEKTTRKKKLVILSIVLCAVLIVLLFGMILAIQHQDSITEKFFLDGKQISKQTNLYMEVEGTTYIDVHQFSDILKSGSTSLNYDYQKGHYGLYDEDEESCLIDNGFETLAMSADNKYYNKYINKAANDKKTLVGLEVIIKSEAGYSEKFTIENPIRYINGKIYVPIENIEEMFNVKLDWKEYRKKIYSFEYMLNSAKEQVAKVRPNQLMSGSYENLKATLYGYVVLTDENDINYSVYSLEDGSDRLSSKYKDIKFVQNAQEFYISADNGTMGLVSADGTTIIKTSQYETISLLDDDAKLYMVEDNKEVGVINKSGKTIIFTEYDGIGYDTSKYSLDIIENEKLLANKFIPVEKNKKYGLYNTEGDPVLNAAFDGFGYVSSTGSNRAGDEESILFVPKEEGINGMIVSRGDLYGIFDIDEETLVLPCSYSKIYAIRSGGQIKYYIEFAGETFELKDFLKANGIYKNYDLLEKENSKESRKTEELDEDSSVENTVTVNTVVDTDDIVDTEN